MILAFSTGAATFSEEKPGVVTIDWSNGSVATIVDGQHRIFGMNAFDPSTEIPVIGLLDADEEGRVCLSVFGN